MVDDVPSDKLFNRIVNLTEDDGQVGEGRLCQDTIWFVFLRSRLRCSDTEFAEPSFVLMFAWTLIDNSLFRHIEH
jgi:hypothetical protein